MPRRGAVRIRLRRWLRNVIRARGSPEAIALGFAIGAFFAFMPPPPFGLQMILAVLVATAVGASRVPAIAATWITNPLTTPTFFLPLCYEVGRLTLGFLGVNVKGQWEILRKIVSAADPTSCAAMRQVAHDTIGLGWSIFGPYLLGDLMVGAFLALVSYPIVLRLVKGHILLRSQKRARRWQKMVERAQERGETPHGPPNGAATPPHDRV